MARRARRRAASLGAYLRRTSFNRGLLGDDRVWRAVFMVLTGRRMLKKVMGSEPTLVATEQIEPGSTIQISSIDPVAAKRPRRRA